MKLVKSIFLISIVTLAIVSSFYFYPVSTNTHPLISKTPPSNYLPVTNETLAYYSALNHNNTLLYNHDITTPCKPSYTINSSGVFANNFGFCGKAIVTVYIQQERTADIRLLNLSFYASCMQHCTNGIIYKVDPTAIMTNNGHDFMFNCKDFGGAQAVYCHGDEDGANAHSNENATSMMLSTSAGALAVTDTGCGGGAGSGQITTGGLADALGTFTGGTPSAGSVTSTLAHTWTAAETDSNVQVQCVNTELHTGSHVTLVYEFSFGPITLASGNTLAITDALTGT